MVGISHTKKKKVKKKCKLQSFWVGSECFPFGISDRLAPESDNMFPSGHHLFCDSGVLGINTPHCTCRDRSPSSQLGCRLLRQGACFLSPTDMQQELSAELMEHHARSRWPTTFCPICPSSRSKASFMTVGRVRAAWCTCGSPKPRATPSPGTIRPQMQARGRGDPFNNAWKCSLEESPHPQKQGTASPHALTSAISELEGPPFPS